MINSFEENTVLLSHFKLDGRGILRPKSAENWSKSEKNNQDQVLHDIIFSSIQLLDDLPLSGIFVRKARQNKRKIPGPFELSIVYIYIKYPEKFCPIHLI